MSVSGWFAWKQPRYWISTVKTIITTASTTKKIGAVGTPIHQVSNRIDIYEITVIAITIRPKDAEYLSMMSKEKWFPSPSPCLSICTFSNCSKEISLRKIPTSFVEELTHSHSDTLPAMEHSCGCIFDAIFGAGAAFCATGAPPGLQMPNQAPG